MEEVRVTIWKKIAEGAIIGLLFGIVTQGYVLLTSPSDASVVYLFAAMGMFFTLYTAAMILFKLIGRYVVTSESTFAGLGR